MEVGVVQITGHESTNTNFNRINEDEKYKKISIANSAQHIEIPF
jgi:hypothetical protein